MSGETEASVSGWTTDTLRAFNDALRLADERLRDADHRFYEERDRRYSEVALEREKALKIKETADLAALSLAREIQDYKDEKANNLREQISGERGVYATKEDLTATTRELVATIKPLAEYVTSQQGRGLGMTQLWSVLIAAARIAIGVAAFATR
jgi:hypothetical protein